MSEDRTYFTCRLPEGSHESPVETTIRSLYKVLLDRRDVDAFLTFTEKKAGGGMQAISVETSADISNLDNRLLSQYLVTRLPRLLSIPKIICSQLAGCYDKRVAFIARPCEIEALVELSKRHQVAFENLFIIGLECPGSVSFSELTTAIKKQGVDPSGIQSCQMTTEEVSVNAITGKNLTLKLGRDVKLRDCCTRCSNREPPVYDINLSTWRKNLSTNPTVFIGSGTSRGGDCIALAKKQGLIYAATDSELAEKSLTDTTIRGIQNSASQKLSKENEELERLEGKERFGQLKRMLDPCTKCGLCVRACPVCWCKDCILLKKIKAIDVMLLHTTRLVHMGDTCVNCGKCDENCPKNIQLSRIYYGLATAFGKLSGYKPGHDLAQPSYRSGKAILSKT